MDENMKDFFTTEALKILEGFDGFSGHPSQPQGFILSEEASEQSQKILTQPRRRKRGTPVDLPGRATLNLEINEISKSKRRKFEPKRRMEVAKVRKLGACMRCKQMKISAGISSHNGTNATLTRLASVFRDSPLWSLRS